MRVKGLPKLDVAGSNPVGRSKFKGLRVTVTPFEIPAAEWCVFPIQSFAGLNVSGEYERLVARSSSGVTS